ncbi:hypothetical protein KUTeg_007210 [Tegillarca granosa]|uniref:RRM domain-containing protein n=1 Tax=Tegillarca granosa TaxID=220873 RepID=A0ABQ9FH94_TEGGR|nr:hypothetical protein KUTeg_007210 [Tegillarca granosa]
MSSRTPTKPPTDNRKETPKGQNQKKENESPSVKNEQSGPGGEGPTVKTESGDRGQPRNENHHRQDGPRGRGGFRGGRGGRGGGRGQHHGGGGGPRQGHQEQRREHEQERQDRPDPFIQTGPKVDKKFTGRCRLFVGNITPDITEEEFKEMFQPYGEVSEVFVNGAKGFGFIRLDYRHNAEAAKAALDGTQKKGRLLRIRFANHGAAVKVKNLSPYVTNELLEQAFSQFGEIERAIVIADDRGRSAGEGIIEFARKPGATQAIKRVNEGVFLLSASPRPCTAEPLEQFDDEDGLSEKFLFRNDQCRQDREKEPRFAPPGSFDYRFGLKHKEIDEMEKQGYERVKKDAEIARKNLESEMESAMYDYQADQIRQDLMRQQEELKRLEELKNRHMQYRQEMDMRRQEEDRMRRDEEDRMRDMMMRNDNMRGGGGGGGAQPGGPMMDQPGGMRDGPLPPRGHGHPPVPPPPAPPASLGMENNGNSPMPGPGNKMGGPGGAGFGGPGGGNMNDGPGMGPGGNRPKPGGMPDNMGNRGGNPMRQSRFEQPGGGGFDGGFGNRGPGGMGGQSPMGGGGMPSQSPLFSGAGGGQGGMGNRGGNMDRRREGGPNRDDFDNKRMRRY